VNIDKPGGPPEKISEQQLRDVEKLIKALHDNEETIRLIRVEPPAIICKDINSESGDACQSRAERLRSGLVEVSREISLLNLDYVYSEKAEEVDSEASISQDVTLSAPISSARTWPEKMRLETQECHVWRTIALIGWLAGGLGLFVQWRIHKGKKNGKGRA
jgi:hypothetical protein